jgi:citrate synthase
MGALKLQERKELQVAELSVAGTRIELPIFYGTEGEKALDISKLRNDTGFITLDPAYMNTASCTSEITYLDGESGILRYRGYPIEQLAAKASFLEVSYLLLQGELPTASQLEDFRGELRDHSSVSPFCKNLIRSFPGNAHPMGVLAAVTVALSAENPAYLSQGLSLSQRQEVTAQLMQQVKSFSAYFYRHMKGLTFVESQPRLDYCEDFLTMLFGQLPTAEATRALNVLFILHADHEQNCSTSTVRLVGSSKANPYATISAGMGALWGPLHGGANQAVIEMLEDIRKEGGGVKKFVEKAKNKSDSFVLMGFGHRVYKNFDPRAVLIKKACDEVLEKLHVHDPLLDIAKALEEEALRDPYFIERKLYPNVDFYSGIIYKALGIPVTMFTVLFALGRLPGWLAQWQEMLAGSGMKIGRPRQIYVGVGKRDWK